MAKADTDETFTLFTKQVKQRYPDFAYLHLIEPRAAGDGDAEAKEGDSLRTLTDVWQPKVVLIAGGHGKDGAERVCKDYENSVAVFGRYFIRNPDLVSRVKWDVDFIHYDRDTFYTQGPEAREGYVSYEAEWGPDGKIEK
jgi:NADPH2 dehydrogenase